MRWLLLCLGLAQALRAEEALRIIGVERQGLPPYEAADRSYRLSGGQDRGLHVGDRLLVKRIGEARALGHLWVTEIQGGQARARFEPLASVYPMKGDTASPEVLRGLPEAVRLEAAPLAQVSSPRATNEAPPREGVLYFLPQEKELSLAGLKKLEVWVETWGTAGRWALQVPPAKTRPALQKQRTEALQAALRALGIEHFAVETGPRTAEGKNDPAWVRHWD
jgi:hypothetical protein